jgi:hypothetical protein
MDKKPFSSNKSKGGKSGRRGIKNAGFIALLVLFGLIIAAAYNQPNNLQSISTSQAIREANGGQYSKVLEKGNELTITKKGESKPVDG